MSEEAATHTLSLSHAETQTHNLENTTHTGGPMQLQVSTETEEKRVSTYNLGGFCFCVLNWARLKSTAEFVHQRLFLSGTVQATL